MFIWMLLQSLKNVLIITVLLGLCFSHSWTIRLNVQMCSLLILLALQFEIMYNFLNRQNLSSALLLSVLHSLILFAQVLLDQLQRYVSCLIMCCLFLYFMDLLLLLEFCSATCDSDLDTVFRHLVIDMTFRVNSTCIVVLPVWMQEG